MWPMAKLEGKKQIQDPSLVFWTFVLPIVFIVGFISIFSNTNSDKVTLATNMITGFNIFFSIFIIISIVISFVKDREKGLVARLASTPLKPENYFIGKCVPFIIIVTSQMLILTSVGVVFYDGKIESLFHYFLLILLLAIMVTLWGAAISTYSKTENSGLIATQLLAFGGAIFGGLWFPFEVLPDAVQTIGKALPFYWIHQGLADSASGTIETNKILLAYASVAIYSLIGFVAAKIGYKKFLRESKM